MKIATNITNSADGTPIAWYDFGGTGPDALLAHATGFCGSMWEPVVAHLRNHLRCVAYDVRGHGASGRPAAELGRDGFDWNRFADDAIAVLHAANLERPYGIGHSSGGATELLVEERNADTFQALFGYEPVIFAVEPPSGPMPDRDLAIRTRKRRTSFPSQAEAIANFSERGPFVSLDREALEAYVDHGFQMEPDNTLTLRCKPDDEADVYVMASAHRGFSELTKVTCPVTLGHGETSTSFSVDEMQAVVDRLPNARLIEFSGLGHFGPLEAPKSFADVVLQTFGLIS